MKAITYREFGGTAVLQTVEEPVPSVLTGQVLVKVKAISINPLDWKIRKGQMKLMSGSKFPKHTATDFAGVVEQAGPGVANFKKGDEVLGIVKNNMKDGALAEYVSVSSSNVWNKPASISYVEAASIPTVGFAAALTIQKINDFGANPNVLINGAAGGFGMFLLQLLKQQGINTTAVVGTNALKFAKQWGASQVIDYKKDDVLLKTAVYDVVVDLSGRMSYNIASTIMKKSSIFINPIPNPFDILVNPIKNFFRGKKHIALLSAPSNSYADLLMNAIESGLQIEVSKVFQFSETKKAYDYAEAGAIIGKVAIELN